MDERDRVNRFTLLGGPLHRLGARLGLVREGSNTLPLGIALGVLAWTPLVILAFVEGRADRLFSLTVVGVHVRLLAVIPLFFLGELWFDPAAATFVQTLRRSGILPDDAAPALARTVARTTRAADSWIPDAMCVIGAVLLSVYAASLPLHGATSVFDAARRGRVDSLAGDWYWLVGLPFFRFLMFRWLWRLGLWSWFLWRLTRLGLDLRPTHPDGFGGLAFIEFVQARFTPLVFALSAVQSAALAEELAGGAPFQVVYGVLAAVLATDAALFLGPLFVFAPRLWASRLRGMADLTTLGQRYVTQFDARWLRSEAAPLPELLGNPDIQSLADLSNAVRVARRMGVAPIGTRLVRSLAVAAILPMLPLSLFEHRFLSLLESLLARLVGL